MTTQGSATKQPFNNPTSQAERARVIRDEKWLNTRKALQEVLDPSLGGRFARARVEEQISPTSYPRLPDNSPWHHDSVPDEEPFGIDIQSVAPCGEPVPLQHL
jgi:hypothetical protein